jgi:hypothetical protein
VGGKLGAGTPLASSEVYNRQADRWDPLPAVLPVRRASLSAERGEGNRILAIGGFEPGSVASNRVEALKL